MKKLTTIFATIVIVIGVCEARAESATRGNLKMPWGNGCSENLVKRGLCKETESNRNTASPTVRKTIKDLPAESATRGNLKMPWGNGCSENLVKRGLCK
jgi:hypothetical protein